MAWHIQVLFGGGSTGIAMLDSAAECPGVLANISAVLDLAPMCCSFLSVLDK